MREFRSFSSAQSSNPRGSTHSHPSLLVIRISDPPWQAAGLWERIQERGGSWGQTYSRMETRMLGSIPRALRIWSWSPCFPTVETKGLGLCHLLKPWSSTVYSKGARSTCWCPRQGSGFCSLMASCRVLEVSWYPGQRTQ